MNFPLSDTNNIEENSSDTSFNSNNDFFQIGFDDLLISSQFSTYLFDLLPENAVQQLILPQNTSVVDFLSDPVAFTADSTSEIVWKSIISPILSGKSETKPYMYQILSLLFKYFTDHPNTFIENEINRRNEINKAANTRRNTVVTSHYSSTSQKFHNSDDFLTQILEDDYSFPAQQSANVNPSLFEMTQKLYSDAKQKLTERHAFAFFKWGLHSNDISSVIYSLLFFGRLLIQQKRFQKVSIDFSIYKDSFYTFSLNNAVFTQSQQTQCSSIELFEYQPILRSSSMIGCDAQYIYLFNSNLSINRIDLSTENLHEFFRIANIPLLNADLSSNSKVGFATSNGYAIFLGIKNKPVLYKLPDFQYVTDISFNQNQKICLPLTSDGYYIYSLQTMKKKLNIFTLSQNGLTFIKSVTLQINDKKSLLLFQKIIPTDVTFPTFCNGTVFTICLFYEKTDNKYRYVFRHFSVIDGMHIIDNYIELKWGLLSIACYPWENKILEISSTSDGYSLFKVSNNSAQPLWLSNNIFIENPTFSHELSTARRLKDAFQYVLNFLYYYACHFHGYSFNAYINNPIYYVPSSQFFSPCSLNVINAIIEAIRFFIIIYLPDPNLGSASPSHSDSSFPKEWMKTAITVLFCYLEMNLSNFADRKVEGKVTSINGSEGPIIDCFMEVIKHEELQFLIPMIGFIISNSFQVLFRNPNEKLYDLFFFLYQHLSENLLFYMIKQISIYPDFVYAFNNKKIRVIFSPILQKLKNGKINYFEKEILSIYLRNIMLEMRQVYTSFQGSFSLKQENLQESFHNFSTVVVEQATNFFLTLDYDKEKFDETKFDDIPFIIFFKKWLALLEPFPQFNRASLLITSIIQPLNTTITQIIKKKNISCEPIPGEKRFHKLSMIFFEIFSLFINSISALLDGGAEIRDVCQYDWFVQSTKNENVTTKKINEWVQKLALDVGVITKGVSFVFESKPKFNEQAANLSDLAKFINDLSSINPTQSTEQLMDYLHEKVKNPINKKLTEEDKKIERIILAALVKQLGLTNELFNVRSELEKKANPVISHLVKQTMTSLYRIRNQIRLSKQMTAQYQTNNAENMSIQAPAKYEDYDKFVFEIMKKTAFLLNTQPCLRKNQENNLQSNQKEKDFSDMLKQLQSFIISKITIDQYLQMIDSAVISSKNISTGVAFISSKLREDIKSNTKMDKVCSSYMIEKLSSNDSIQYYLSTLGKGILRDDVANIFSLFPLLIDMIKNQSINVSLYPLIVFFMNTSIIQFTEDKILDVIDKLVEVIIDPNYSTISENEISSVLVFISSALLNLIETDSSFKKNEILIRIFDKIINFNDNNLPLKKICFKAGMKVPDTIKDLFLFLSNGSPSDYHIVSLYIFDMISENESKEEKIENIFQILIIISLTVSGCDSVIMEDFPYFNQKNTYSRKYTFKSSPLIISCCSELIQICRRLLNQDDEEMKYVITSVLKYYSNNDNSLSEKLIKIMNKTNLLFGVFAILSNLIEEIHSNSLIKDTKTNQLYYIESTNDDNSIYDVWQLPINQNSVKTKISINSDFIPVSLMPFQVNLFIDYSLLIPYFNDALSLKLNPGLSILVFASLREYSTNISFLKDFIQQLNPISLKNIDYTNSLPFYIKLLRSHLMQKSEGFLEKYISTDFKFFDIFNPFKFYTSPFTIRETDKLFLISPIIPLNTNFQIVINISSRHFDFGVFCPSLKENYDHLYYSKNGNSYISERIKVIYDTMMGVALIVNVNQKVKMFSKKIENPFCIVLNIISCANVSYYLSKTDENTNDECDQLNLDTFKQNEISLSRNDDNNIIDNTFMSIPFKVLSNLPRSLVLKSEEQDSSKSKKIFPVFYDLQKEINYWQTSENYLKIPSKQSIFKYFSKGDNSYLYSITNKISYINNFTGENNQIDIQNIEKINDLPIINLNNFPTLPSQITNYYTTGIASECRNEAYNWIFINLALNSNSIPFEDTIEKFNISNQSLLKHVLNLLLILEPVFTKIDDTKKNNDKENIEKVQIIDFDYNCLNPSSELKMTSFQMFSAAMLQIIEFVDKRNIQNEFADIWLDLLKKQFNNGYSHSCTPSSTSGKVSIFLNMNNEISPVKIDQPNVLGWIVCVVGFSKRYEMTKITRKPPQAISGRIPVSILKNCYCKINGVMMREPLTVVLKSSLTIEFHKKNKTIVLIPITSNSNDSLIGSFFDLALSFKYFVHYVSMKAVTLKKFRYYKMQIYELFFEGIISKSPFFFTYMVEIFRFLQQNQKISSLDFEDDLVLSLNVLSYYCIQIPECENFLREVEELWIERTAIEMLPYFPDFVTDEMKDHIENKGISKEEFKITSNCFPNRVSSSDDLHKIISTTKRTLKKYDTIKGYPYYILLDDWARYTIMYPPYEVTNISQKAVQITFLHYKPECAVINIKETEESDVLFKIADNIDMNDHILVVSDTIFSVVSKTIFIECESIEITSIDFIITSPLSKHLKDDSNQFKKPNFSIEDFIFQHRQEFTSDIGTLATTITSINDQQILRCFSEKIFNKKKTLTFEYLNENPTAFIPCIKSLRHNLNVIVLRAKLLISLNWLVSIRPNLLETDVDMESLKGSVSISFKLSLFNNEINKMSTEENNVHLIINRTEATFVRLGNSTDLTKTIISQMTRFYTDPSKFRCKSDKPWKVKFVNEAGIDAGGLARELVNECALDLMCPNCGLVVPVPNAYNEVGHNDDFFIPIPSPNHDRKTIESQYRFAGALIAICIRTGLVQQFLFPPLVWEYLLNGSISINRVFEIDKNYELLITSLTEAMKSDMSNDEFTNRFNLKFVITNYNRLEVPLTQRGKEQVVDKSNCNEFIAYANKFRLNELESNLKQMRDGFWSNLGIRPLSILDWPTLEFAACGQSEISVDSLMAVTTFDGIKDEQQKIFWKVVEAFNLKERSDLLKFATGRVRLPPKHHQNSKFLKIDELSGIDILPTASTCFHKLHYPYYSSFQKAYKMIKIAIEYSGTFENS